MLSTVKELRKALYALDDDTPISGCIADEHGSKRQCILHHVICQSQLTGDRVGKPEAVIHFEYK